MSERKEVEEVKHTNTFEYIYSIFILLLLRRVRLIAKVKKLEKLAKKNCEFFLRKKLAIARKGKKIQENDLEIAPERNRNVLCHALFRSFTGSSSGHLTPTQQPLADAREKENNNGKEDEKM
jgi:hypothetical protein